MASGLQVTRTVLHVVALLISLIAIGLTVAAIMSSGWQIMVEPGTGEIHQHGLWLDYNLVKPHVAGAAHGPNNGEDPHKFQWIFNYKFGEAIKGDEVHRAKDYQENTLILFSTALFLAIIGCLISYCSGYRVYLGAAWALFMFFASILSAAALIQFYLSAMIPEHRFIYTDRRVEQVIGYSFWRGVIAAVGYALAMVLSMICVVLTILSNRMGLKTEKVPFTFRRGNNTQV